MPSGNVSIPITDAAGNVTNAVIAVTTVDPATVPARPAFTVTLVAGRPRVAWTPPADGGSPITGYTVVRDFWTAAQATIPVGLVTSWTDTTAPAGTHTYTVSAENIVGSSGGDGVQSVTIPATTSTLPADLSVGRAASDYAYWGSWELGLQTTPTQVTNWRTNLGFNVFYPRLGNGRVYGFDGDQRLVAADAFQAPYAGDPSYDWQRTYQTSGVFKAKKDGQPIKVGFFQKIHKNRDNTYTAPNVGGDLGPFGGSVFDPAHRAAVRAAYKEMWTGAKWLGATHFNMDPEFGTWDYPPMPGQTMDTQQVALEQFGYEVCSGLLEADPHIHLSHYGMPMSGNFHNEVIYKNGSSTDGAYWHPPSEAEERSRFATKVPITALGQYHEDQAYAGWQFKNFLRGMWRAMADFAADDAAYAFQDAFWYHAGVQYSGVTLETAMRWNLWGLFSHLSRDHKLNRKTKHWIMRHLLVQGVAWAGTDGGNGYFNTQLRDPAFGDLTKALRVWSMRMHVEYGHGHTPYTPDGFVPTGVFGGTGNNSSGRPAISFGRNLYTGALHAGRTPTTAQLGSVPLGGGAPGETITYDQAGVATTPTDWTHRFVPTAARAQAMRDSASTASLGTPPPTITDALAVRLPDGNVRVTCKVRHPHAPAYVEAYDAELYVTGDKDRDDAPSRIDVAAMVFEPNNGTNRPPAGLADPYQNCTLTSTGGGWVVGDRVYLGAKSTKDDEKWLELTVA
jgi:hypothetical protein